MTLRLDDELLSFFPDRKKNDKLALGDVLDVDHEPESTIDEELEEDIAGETPPWENEESEEDLVGKPGPEAGSVLQPREEEPGVQEAIDDSVHAYLRDIGRVQLITANDEKVLASKLEEAKYLRKIEELYFKQCNIYPSTEAIIIFLLRHLLAAQPLIDILTERLELPPENSFVRNIRNEKLETAVNSVIDQTLINDISETSEEDISEVEQQLINVSLNSRPLPPELLTIIGDETSWRKVESIVSEPINPEFLSDRKSVV